jgi:hypothetical protein
MPLWETEDGKPVYIPPSRVTMLEPGQGGLTTCLHMTNIPGRPGELLIELSGRVESNAAPMLALEAKAAKEDAA